MATMTLNSMAKEELALWIKKIRIKQWSGRYSPYLTDTNADRCFQKSWGTVCQGIRTGDLW